MSFSVRHAARASIDAIALALFPSRATLDVVPGSARLQAGATLDVNARLIGSTAPVAMQLLRLEENDPTWRAADMTAGDGGRFQLSLGSLNASFKYKVVAGLLSSPVFDVSVLRPPRVTRIDVAYSYPRSLGLESRVEEDSGDVYAPVGTDVQLRIHVDRPAAAGQLLMSGGAPIGTGTGLSKMTRSPRLWGGGAAKLSKPGEP